MDFGATTRNFMARVVPWPGPGEKGYINIHWKVVNKDHPEDRNRDFFGGRAFTTVDDLLEQAKWGDLHPNIIKDIYFCLSLQAKHGGFSAGRMKAKRDAKEALALKAIWLDIDIKEPPKGYASLKEALHALQIFLNAAKLPFPTAVIKSGGGLHVYWISNRPLTVDEWRPYAEGLKQAAAEHHLRADLMVTADPARILRVPDTRNWKGTPAPVTLGHLSEDDLDFATSLAHLAVKVPERITVAVKPEYDMSGFKMSPAFASVKAENTLASGIDTTPNIKLDFLAVAKQCPMWGDAVVSGGADHPEPLWQLLVLGSTFFQNGEVIAHEIGNKHPGYTAASTEAKYAQKVNQKEQKDLGYPTCQAYKDAGCKHCETCPLFGKIKSPLNLGIVHPVAAPPEDLSQSAASQKLSLPPGYFVADDGIICKWFKDKKGKEYPLPMFLCKILKVVPRKEPVRGLELTFEEDLGNIENAIIPQKLWGNTSLLTSFMGDTGCKYNPDTKMYLESFFMSWLKELHKAMASVKSKPFGWSPDYLSFAFGGTIFHKGGQTELCGIPDPQIRSEYEIAGDTQAWYDAAQHIFNQKRPHLDIIIAAHFASPILEFAGESGGTLAPWGQSGTNKSSAVKVGLAIWGDAKSTKLPPKTTTPKALEGRLAMTACLPLVIDDAQEYDEFKKAAETVFVVTAGSAGARMKSDQSMRGRGKWKSLMILTANYSLHRYMIDVKKTRTTAELVRAFEIVVPPADANTPGRVRYTVTDPLLNKLEFHHGGVGAKYVQWLVDNYEYVRPTMTKFTNEFMDLVNMEQPERFWVTLCGSVLAAAHFANLAVGTPFDIEAMKSVLLTEYFKNRKTVKEARIEGDTFDSSESVVHDFIVAHVDNQMWTGAMESATVGRKRLQMIQNVERTPLLIHWDVENRRVHFDKKAFFAFMIEQGWPTTTTMDGLRDNLGATIKKWRLGSGTPHSHSPDYVIEIPIDKGHPLELDLFKPIHEDELPAHVKARREAEEPVTQITATVKAEPVLDGELFAAAKAQADKDLQLARENT